MTNCVEALACPPVNIPDVLNLYDVWFGAGMTILIMALIVGIITLAIYMRTRSMPMLVILGIYEVSAFSSILTSKYISSQYHIMEYVIIFGVATAIVMMVLRLVKE